MPEPRCTCLPALGLTLLMLVPTLIPTLAQAGVRDGDLVGHALVQDDGGLLIKGQTVRLGGIYLPETNRECRAWINPVRCGSRGALALDFRVKGFIHCFLAGENDDGSVNGTCYVDRSRFDPGEDLAAYLLERGLALALPNAPFEYQAMEKIARAQGQGVWGFMVDDVSQGIYAPGKGYRSHRPR